MAHKECGECPTERWDAVLLCFCLGGFCETLKSLLWPLEEEEHLLCEDTQIVVQPVELATG